MRCYDFAGEEPIAQAKKWAKENLVGKHELTDNDGNTIKYLISNRTVTKYLSSSAIDKSASLGVHLATLKRLPEIISESLEVEIHPDYQKNDIGNRVISNINHNVLIHRFYGLSVIDGEIYRVKTTIQESKILSQPIVPHSFEVTEIELLPEDNSSIRMEPTDRTEHAEVSHRTAKLLNGIEKSYDSGKIYQLFDK